MRLLIVVGIIVVILLWVLWIVLARALRRLQTLRDDVQGRVIEARVRFLPPGPRRDAALLRRRLQAEVRATRDLLGSVPDGLIFRADAAAVLDELATTAGALDRDLAAVERFLEPAEQRSALATLRPQAEQVIATTYSARQIVLRTAAEDRTRRLNTLQDDVARQAAALEFYRNVDRDPQI